MPLGADLTSYNRALIERIKNPALRHRTWQIAMDGSEKLPQRLLGTVRNRLQSKAPINRLVLGVAAWMRYVTGIDEKGNAIDVRDPMAALLRERADRAGGSPERLAEELFSLREIFGEDLPHDERFTVSVTNALKQFYANGARQAVAHMTE